MGTTFFSDIKRDKIHLSVGNCHEKEAATEFVQQDSVANLNEIHPSQALFSGRDESTRNNLSEKMTEQRKLQFRSCWLTFPHSLLCSLFATKCSNCRQLFTCSVNAHPYIHVTLSAPVTMAHRYRVQQTILKMDRNKNAVFCLSCSTHSWECLT